MDIFKKLEENQGPLGQYYKEAHGYFMFPKLEGEIGPRMTFRGREVLNWSLNNYIGLANYPEVRKADAEGAARWGLAYPMGARMMSGQTSLHEKLEGQLAEFMQKEDAYLLNFGYQGMLSIIDAICSRNDVIVYDSNAHACIIDGMRLHIGKRFVYQHNDMESLEKQLARACALAEKQKGGVLVITEGVFGMSGVLGQLDEIAALKDKYEFRLLVDDAHGFGSMGPNGRGTAEHFGVLDKVDLCFATFAKSMALIGGFVAGKESIINYLRYNMRSQIYAKSLPMPIVEGALKRLELLKTKPELREKLWTIVNALQSGLREKGFNLGKTKSMVTPVYLSGNPAEGTNLVMDLRENYNLFCSMVLDPVIPKGELLLRLIPTATHTLDDVNYTIKAFSEIKANLEAGKYNTDTIASISMLK